MKKLLFFIGIGLFFLSIQGCEDCCEDRYYDDNRPPAPPTGLYSVTGDQEVRLYWDRNDEYDLDGYRVYWNDSPYGWFEFITETRNNQFVDTDVHNGQTYYYAVSAVDYDGNESDLSYNNVSDTPRPEGYNQRLFSMHGDEWEADNSGWSFHLMEPRYWEDPRTDIFYEFIYDTQLHQDFHYLNIDFYHVKTIEWGYTEDLDQIDYAPENDWETIEWVELSIGKAYVFKIQKPEGETHYAKLRVRALESGVMRFDWAYQIDPYNRELSFDKNKIYISASAVK